MSWLTKKDIDDYYEAIEKINKQRKSTVWILQMGMEDAKKWQKQTQAHCLDFDHFSSINKNVIKIVFLYFVIFKSKSDITFSYAYFKSHKYVKIYLFMLKNISYLLKVNIYRLRGEIEKPCV